MPLKQGYSKAVEDRIAELVKAGKTRAEATDQALAEEKDRKAKDQPKARKGPPGKI